MAAIHLALPETIQSIGRDLHTLEYVPHPLFDEADTPADAEATIEALNPGLPVADRENARPYDEASDIIRLCAAPMLTKPQERYLFTRMNLLKFLAAEEVREAGEKPKAAQRRKIEELLQEALIVRNVIVESNLRLVTSIAKKYVTANQSLEEAISEGFSPLIRAVELFDCSRGLAFSTYATHCVQNALGRTSSKIERRRKKQGRLSNELIATVAEDRSTVTNPEPLINRWERMASELLVHLDDRERIVISARFGIGDDDASSFEQIGQRISLSKERVRQISLAAIAKLQRIAHEAGFEFPEPETIAFA